MFSYRHTALLVWLHDSDFEENTDYEDTIINKEIELLKAIRMITHDLMIAKYPLYSIIERIYRIIKIKKYEERKIIE